MLCRGLLIPIVLFLNAVAFAQFPTTPTPTPNPNSRQGQAGPIIADNVDFERLRVIEMMIPKDRAPVHPMLDLKKGLYRRPGKEEVEILAVNEPLLVKHAEFLEMPNTGIVKLNAESSCISTADIVVATEKCVRFKMPGAGAAFSFRTESYRLPRLADVILFDGVFKTGGVLQQVIMANIGDVAIEHLSLDSKGIKYLTDLKPVRDSVEFMQFDSDLARGIEAQGFLYGKGQMLKEESTFALRSIAYRGNYMRTVDGISYNELDFDKRRDIIIVFRVVDKDAAGNITIVWKLLKDSEAPKLKIKQ